MNLAEVKEASELWINFDAFLSCWIVSILTKIYPHARDASNTYSESTYTVELGYNVIKGT
jgi:hypothetical protein